MQVLPIQGRVLLMKLLVTIDHPDFIEESNIKNFITSVLKLESMRGDFKITVEDYNGTTVSNEQGSDT